MGKHRKGTRARKNPWFKPRTRLDARTYAMRLMQAIDTPVSLGCYLQLKHGEDDQYIDRSVDPLQYDDPASFFLDYLAVKVMSKYPFLETDRDRQAVAWEAFDQAERQCAQTNHRFLSRRGEHSELTSVAPVLFRAQQKISAILGPVPSLSELPFSFGPGASYGVRGDTSVYKKLCSEPECTFAMLRILEPLVKEVPGWFRIGSTTLALRQGSELTFVPKNAKTDRPICIEPLLNGFVQKGIGTFLRGKLSRHGVNLDDQGVNQKLASVAVEQELATVDFSSASDTISYGVVLDLLPIDWVELLDVARCPAYSHNGTWRAFEKFSSMGNAYTFELESLIFYALAFATCEYLGIEVMTGENVSVYGDDVIIPTRAFPLFQEVCSLCGFSVNEEKSFSSGPFRESCGKDYYLGHLVRPFHLKKRVVTLEDHYYVANQTLAMAERVQDLPWSRALVRQMQDVHARLLDLHAWCVGAIPRRHRHTVPSGTGDCGLVAPFDVAVPSRPSSAGPRAGWEGWEFSAVQTVSSDYKFEPWDWIPMGYALYQDRNATGTQGTTIPGLGIVQQVSILGERSLGVDASWVVMKGATLVVSLSKGRLDAGIDSGIGYPLRGKTLFREGKTFLNGPWPDCPAWGDHAVRLINA